VTVALLYFGRAQPLQFELCADAFTVPAAPAGASALKLDLFQAIGGRRKINQAVEIFYRKVLADPSLRGFFHASDMNGLRAKQAMFLTMLLGGEHRYSGKDLGEAHAPPRHIGLTEAHFDTFVGHFCAALEEIGVAPDVIAQIAQKLETTRASVLGR